LVRMFALLQHVHSQSLVFLGEPGIEGLLDPSLPPPAFCPLLPLLPDFGRPPASGGQNNADYMMTTTDDHDMYGAMSPGRSPRPANNAECRDAARPLLRIRNNERLGASSGEV